MRNLLTCDHMTHPVSGLMGMGRDRHIMLSKLPKILFLNSHDYSLDEKCIAIQHWKTSSMVTIVTRRARF